MNGLTTNHALADARGSVFGQEQFLTPKKLAWVMDVGESTVADWLRAGARGRPPLVSHFRQGRIIRIEPIEAWRFVWNYTLRAAGGDQSLAYARGSVSEEQFELLAVRLEQFTSVRLKSLLELNGHLEAA